MRRILSIALAVLMLLSVATVGVFTVSAEDTETDAPSYEIPADAQPVSSYVDFTMMTKSGVYYLDADFSVSNSYSSTFSGTLYGNGHTITTYVPLFTTLNGATITDLTLEGEIYDESPSANYIGTLASAAGNTVIDGVVSNVNIIGGEKTYAGGIVGFARGGSNITITNCVNNGKIDVGQQAGGIIVYSEADVTTIEYCTNNGDMISTMNKDTSGILGYVTSAEGTIRVLGCVNNGHCYGNRPGGIVGVAENIRLVTLEDCVNTGFIQTETNYCGGITGRIDPKAPAIFRSCINTGDVEIYKSQGGGMIGYSGSSNDGQGCFKFYGCVNTGKIYLANAEKTDQTGNCGGIVGVISGRGEFYGCVNYGDVISNCGAGGIAKNVGAGASPLKGIGGHQMHNCANFGDIYSYAVKGGRTDNVSPLIAYAWGDLHTSNNVAAGSAKANYTVAQDVANKRMAAGVVGYSNNGGGMYKNNYILAELDAGPEGVVVAMGNYLTADWTNKIGNQITGNYAITEMPYIYDQIHAESAFKCPTVDKTLYDTDEEICALLNKLVGYEAFVVITEEDKNEFGLVGVFPASTATLGNGAKDKEAVAVGTAAEFLAMDPAGNYYLTADITLTESYKGAFSGKLDGKGFTLTLSAPAFELITHAEISDLSLKGYIEKTNEYLGKRYTMADYAGALASVATGGTYTNVTNFATVKAFDEAGGLVGRTMGGTYIGCVNNGAIYANNCIGGIVGMAMGSTTTFENCVNNGSVDRYNFKAGSGGGILGRSELADIVMTNCVNNGLVQVKGMYSRSGGMLGYAYGCRRFVLNKDTNTDRAYPTSVITLTGCFNNADVVSGDQGGGMIGWCEATANLTDCVNNGDVRSTQNYCGGLVGRAGSNAGQSKFVSTFTNCVNNGNVTTHRQYGGGIVGYSQENLKFVSCVNNGTVTGDDIHVNAQCKTRGCHNTTSSNFYAIGGMVGRVNFEVKALNCVNTGDLFGNSTVGGMVGECGISVAKGATGVVEFARCTNTGDIYNANLAVINSKTKYNNGTGGIFGTVIIDPALAGKGMNVDACIVANCTITAENTEVFGVRAIGGIGGATTGARATFTNNIVMCELVDVAGNGIKSGLIYGHTTNLDPKNFSNNFVIHTITTEYFDADGRNVAANVAHRGELESGELAYLINQGAGKNVFYQKIGSDLLPTAIPGATPAIIYYDWQNDCYTNEYVAPKPVETTTEKEETTEEPTPTQPVVTQPVVTQPVVTDPIVTDPIVTDPIVTDPIVTDPATEPVTDPVTEPVTDPVTEPVTEPAPEKGCGGVIGASFAVAMMALVAPAALILKKKED